MFWDFSLTLHEYAELGVDNEFPLIDRCPHCRGAVTLLRHGFYWRNALEGDREFRIPICRLKCPVTSCKRTISLLPTFLIPHFQYSLDAVIQKLWSFFVGGIIIGYRQLVAFYRKRFLRQLTQIEMFFRDEGHRQPLPADPKEKAIKLLEMILALGKATFVRRSTGHFKTNFMAN